MEKPLVSVVLCTYNGEKFLEEQVRSILAQTHRPLELIIADDASTDGTRAVLQQFKTDPLVRIYYQETNTGLTRNFAFAAGKTKGQLIAFSDQDDVWKADKVEKLVAAIGNSPLVYSNSLLVDEAGNSLHKTLSDLKRMYSGTDSRCYILYSCVWGHGMLITRALLEKCLPMPAEIHHDIWIVYQAFQHGGIQYLDEVLTFYRQHSSSTSQTLPEKNSTRKKKSRYEAYKEKLHWIKLMQQQEREEYQLFYQKLVKLYAAKEKGYVFALVLFMLAYRKAIFRLSNKSFVSQFIEILKQARAERP